MDQLIPVVNKLQDVFAAIGNQTIDLPQITVVGSQSSGKSSVLEALVGRDFLPRGSGVVTRRPLILQLYSIAGSGPSREGAAGDEWGEFLHIPGQKFYDFEEIRAEIQRETDRVTGKNKGISNKSINLKIFSPYVLNLTLVDLPGITKVPTGDQPDDIEDQIRSMCFEFISNPNAIVLAVTAANQDLVNSDGLKMARTVDPDGERTVGVLTKVDIMDAGTDCADILSNRVIPLKRGHIAVVNRSQKDINENVPIRAGVLKETQFFQSHHKYRSMLSKCGTSNLSRTLNQILMIHIRDCLPDIKMKISKLMVSVQENIDSLGEGLEIDGAGAGAVLLRVLSKFSANISSCLDGRATGDSTFETTMTELYGGARISYIFSETFGRRLRGLDPFEGLDDEDIRTAIANANGTRPSLFVPEISFDLLVRRQIARLEQPALQCVDFVFDEMQRISGQCETDELNRFPELRERVFEIVNNMLRSCVKPAQQMIGNMIQIELAFINTSHPDFIGGKQALAQISRKASVSAQEGASNSHHNVQAENVRSSSHSQSGTSAQPPPQATPVSSQPAANPPVAPTQPASQQQTNGAANEGKGFFSLFRPAGGQEGVSSSPVPPSQHAPPTATATVTQPPPQPANGHGQAPPPASVTTSRGSARIVSQQMHQRSEHSHSSHRDGVVKLSHVPEKMRIGAPANDWGRREIDIIKTLISSYFDIVRKTVMDLVPKTIMHFLVNGFRENLQNELVSKLYRESMLNELLRENDDVAARRKSCREMKELLQKALDIVNEVRDFKPGSNGRESSIGMGGFGR